MEYAAWPTSYGWVHSSFLYDFIGSASLSCVTMACSHVNTVYSRQKKFIFLHFTNISIFVNMLLFFVHISWEFPKFPKYISIIICILLFVFYLLVIFSQQEIYYFLKMLLLFLLFCALKLFNYIVCVSFSKCQFAFNLPS